MSYRIAIRFAVRGDLRFLSHQDTMRLFERAAVRAQLPLRWGQGFNPRPRFSLPLPRPVGVASEDDLLVLDLQAEHMQAPLQPRQVLARLAEQMPPDVELLDAADTRDTPQPTRATYTVELPPEVDRAQLADRAREVLAGDECIVERTLDAKGNTQPLNIRPYLLALEVEGEAGRMSMTLAIHPTGTARPSEVLSAVGLDPAAVGLRITRRHVLWQPDPSHNATDDRKEQ